MPIPADMLKVVKFLRNNVKTLSNLGLSGGIVAVNSRINSDLFDCPEKNYQLYGYMFLIVPCVILYKINLLIVADKLNPHGFYKTIKEKAKKETKFTIFRNVVLPTISRGFVAPLVWLILSFAQADYYICATVGPGPEKRGNLTAIEAEDLEERISTSKSRSQIVAWILLGVVVLWTFKVKALQKPNEGKLIEVVTFVYFFCQLPLLKRDMSRNAP